MSIPNSAHDDTDGGPRQKLLGENNAILTNIADGAPLTRTLTDIVASIENQNPKTWVAILVLDESGNRLRLGAASSFCPDCNRAINAAIGTAGNKLEANQFWRCFLDLARRQGLHTANMVPIRSPQKGLLGMFVACLQHPDQASDKRLRAISSLTALARIAIERDMDRNDLARTTAALREKETRATLAIEGSGTGIWDRNVPAGEIFYSPAWKAILGYTDSEIGTRINDSYSRVHPDDLARVQATIQAHFDQKTDSYAVEHRIRCKDGRYKWISSRGKVVSRDADGKPLRMIGITTDLTALRTLSERLQQSVDLITNLTNEVPGLVFQYQLSTDGNAFFSYASEGVRDIYEIAPEQVATNTFIMRDIIHPDDYENYEASIIASANNLTPWRLEYRVNLPRQGLRWRQGNARPRRLPDGGTVWHGFIHDVTERKHAETKLQELATIDFLTQLPNRRYFMTRMDEELARIQHGHRTDTAVLMCDLDYFKAINDTYGHTTGDKVLKCFATILRKGLRKDDTVGRVGGEEFAVMLTNAGTEEARFFARRMQKQIAETPLIEGGEMISVTVSIGITVMKPDDPSGAASLSRSDAALYRAKGGGRNRVEIVLDQPQ